MVSRVVLMLAVTALVCPGIAWAKDPDTVFSPNASYEDVAAAIVSKTVINADVVTVSTKNIYFKTDKWANQNSGFKGLVSSVLSVPLRPFMSREQFGRSSHLTATILRSTGEVTIKAHTAPTSGEVTSYFSVRTANGDENISDIGLVTQPFCPPAQWVVSTNGPFTTQTLVRQPCYDLHSYAVRLTPAMIKNFSAPDQNAAYPALEGHGATGAAFRFLPLELRAFDAAVRNVVAANNKPQTQQITVSAAEVSNRSN
jgi:hypothetical protein